MSDKIHLSHPTPTPGIRAEHSSNIVDPTDDILGKIPMACRSWNWILKHLLHGFWALVIRKVIWEEEHKISYHTAFGLRTLHPINKTM
jgi:hypothetical protein